MKNKVEIVYEDDALVVVNKPHSLLTIPDRFDAGKPNLYHQLMQQFGHIITVHRLDRETSGILVFAKTEEAHRELSRQFQERTVQKIYLALVEGQMHQDEGIIDKALGPHPVVPGKMAVVQRGKPSVTHYRVRQRFKNYTLVEADIKTGRTHQIRVHFQALGYPLAVDVLYGRKAAFLLSDVKIKRFKLSKNEEEERPMMARTTLHAAKLTFQHPLTGEAIVVEAPLPKDFSAVVKQLEKWGSASL